MPRQLTPVEQEFARRWTSVGRRFDEGATLQDIVKERPFLQKYVDPASPLFIAAPPPTKPPSNAAPPPTKAPSNAAPPPTKAPGNFFVTKAEFLRIMGPSVDAHVPQDLRPFFTYEGFVEACSLPFAKKFGERHPKREIAALLGNFFQETRFAYHEEIGAARKPASLYGGASWSKPLMAPETPESKGRPTWHRHYHGRGPVQLSWYGNYIRASQAIFGDDRLARHPWLVAEVPAVAWATAIWFWCEHCHAHMASEEAQFGLCIKSINGNQECPSCGGRWDSRAQTRVDKYLEYCAILGVTNPGTNLTC